MRKSILSICFAAFLFVVCAQDRNAVLFTVGEDAVTVTEFINTFNKNNSLTKATENELRDYLDLFINFKLKVKDGIDSQIDTSFIFQNELASYRAQSAQQYLVDKEVSERLINEALVRSKQMVRASHILIMLPPDALPKDTLIAYNKVLEIRRKITSGAITFSEAAIQFSEDPSARDEVGHNGRIQHGNKGDLGYFTVFDLIYPFETAAYNTPVGGYSMPVRSQFGYHLIWVQDRHPMVSRINISQILLLDTAARFGRMSPAVQEKLTLIEEAFKNGEDFATLAEKYTEDPMSKVNEGRIEPFFPNRRPGDYVKQAISLEKDQISAPFPSVIGWHIIKLNEITVPELKDEEMRFSMITRIQRDSRSTKSVESLIEKLKKEYHFSDKGKNAAFNFLLKKLNKENTMPPAADLLTLSGIDKLKPMAIFANQTITIQDFIQYLDRFQGMDLNKQAKMFLDIQYEDFIREFILKYELDILEVKYPEYKELITEYHHGMILFEMNNEKVWNESLKDSAAFEAFYEKIKVNYLDPEGNPKRLTEIRSAVLTEYQNELETEWLMELRKRHPVWINEELFKSILKNK
ncbi:MAG: peptidylprolyl isomerase [Bacteroidetes bacterium]|nr:peptidylprolyl isomerase [Bacteroidota bacterium]MCL2302503.1 peptidylprolyl isomerase [Lentimicrobiaceae bacterium]